MLRLPMSSDDFKDDQESNIVVKSHKQAHRPVSNKFSNVNDYKPQDETI